MSPERKGPLGQASAALKKDEGPPKAQPPKLPATSAPGTKK
jgi:hypothetical protein